MMIDSPLITFEQAKVHQKRVVERIKRVKLRHDSNLKPHSVLKLIATATCAMTWEADKPIPDANIQRAAERLVAFCMYRANQYL